MTKAKMVAALQAEGYRIEPPLRQESVEARAALKADLKRRQSRERAEIASAVVAGKPHAYLDTDGCEVTVTQSGHAFYNVADWY